MKQSQFGNIDDKSMNERKKIDETVSVFNNRIYQQKQIDSDIRATLRYMLRKTKDINKINKINELIRTGTKAEITNFANKFKQQALQEIEDIKQAV